MILRLYSEDIERRHILHGLEFPGCYADGVTEAEALARFPEAWTSYAAWLASHGDVVPDEPAQFVIIECFASFLLADGYEVNAFFSPERRPPSRMFIERCQRLLSHSRADLLAAWQAIPVDRQDVAWIVGERTPRQIVDHVARAEWWYLSNIEEILQRPPISPAPGALAELSTVRALLRDWLTTASDEQLRIISVADKEEWSVRKVLRRALWHERTHTAEFIRHTG